VNGHVLTLIELEVDGALAAASERALAFARRLDGVLTAAVIGPAGDLAIDFAYFREPGGYDERIMLAGAKLAPDDTPGLELDADPVVSIGHLDPGLEVLGGHEPGGDELFARHEVRRRHEAVDLRELGHPSGDHRAGGNLACFDEAAELLRGGAGRDGLGDHEDARRFEIGHRTPVGARGVQVGERAADHGEQRGEQDGDDAACHGVSSVQGQLDDRRTEARSVGVEGVGAGDVDVVLEGPPHAT
jgi:hypothetical protein